MSSILALIATTAIAATGRGDVSVLSFGDWSVEDGSGWAEVHWQSPEIVRGFQFNLSGLVITSIGGGLVEDLGWSLNHDDDTVLCFSVSGKENWIPPNDKPAVLMIVQLEVVEDEIAFAPKIIFADENSEAIEDIDASDVLDVGSSCPADCDPAGGNGVVDVSDLLAVIAAWGQQGGTCDVDGDGIVAVGDVLAVIAAWGTCP